MTIAHRILRTGFGLALVVTLAACSGGGGGFFRQGDGEATSREVRENLGRTERESTIWDLFSNSDNPNTTVEVNRFIWQAALEVLDFLPVESVDPFSGVFVTGYGTPPGGGRAYRATVHVTDPALDARSLNVALVTRNGPASAEVQRAVEDAILTRARQLRVRAGDL